MRVRNKLETFSCKGKEAVAEIEYMCQKKKKIIYIYIFI